MSLHVLTLSFFSLGGKDWHPDNHISFAMMHNKHPFETVTLDYEGQKVEQVLWPVHCVVR